MRKRMIIEFVVLAMLAMGAGPVGAAIWNWSTTASSNATADPSINWAEGMAPSAVNDSARAMMAALAAWRNDISAVNTSAGTSSAYTLTTSEGVTATPSDGQMLSFMAHTTNAVNATLTVDGGTTYQLKFNGANVGAGVIVTGTPYRVAFKSSAWNLEAGYGNPYNISLGGYLYTSVSTAPNSNFVAADGSCISRTTYAAYFALVSTTYGACDGTTTFGVPDMRGRVAAMLDGGANRLTNASTGCGTAFTALGATCANGTQSKTLITANLPPYTPAGTVAITSIALNTRGDGPAAANTQASLFLGNTTETAFLANSQPFASGTATFTGTAQGGTSQALPSIQPTYGVNVFVRIF